VRSKAALEPLLDRLRRRVAARALLRSAALAVLTGLAVAVGLAAVDLAVPLPATTRDLLRWLPLLPLLLPLGAGIQALRGTDDDRLALLVDERGGVGNVASTLRSPNAAGATAELFRARATAALRSVDPAAVLPLGAARLWAACLAALVTVTGLSVALGLDDTVATRWLGTVESTTAQVRADERAPSTPGAAAVTLGAVHFTVRAPSYASLPDVEGRGNDPLSALPGSSIEIRGSGNAVPPALAVSVIGGSTLRPRIGDEGWSVTWSVGPEERGVVLSLSDGDSLLDRRVMALRPLRDRPPAVTLEAPLENMVLASPTGSIPVAATARDDYGVAELTLRWVRSRGSGESFDFEEGTWEWDRTTGSGEVRAGQRQLALGELGLEPGDVLHVRATATDGNAVTGPGRGVSATRQIRISDEGDLSDITTLIGFPMEREREPLLSQRMIILLTEELLDSAELLSEEEVVRRAEVVANEQARLRGRVGEQIFSRATGAMQDPEAHLEFEDGEHEVFLDELEARAEAGPVIDPETGIATIGDVELLTHDHDSDPIVAINRSLLLIYNDMWEAESDLRVARLQASLVPQNRALDALQALREGERVFVRGRVTVAPIDVPGTRGTGEIDDADPALRTPALPSPDLALHVAAAIERMLASDTPRTGRAASVEISGLALDLLENGGAPEAAEALARAADQAGRSEEVETMAALEDALRALQDQGVRAVDVGTGGPLTLAGARYVAGGATADPETSTPGVDGPVGRQGGPAGPAPFTFATVRYSSGDWDSAPLVPANLIHALAQYTSLPVEPEGVIVDLSSPEVFDHPFLYLTGHLPVFFDEAESRNLVDFLERGGLILIDDHNHDIDGAFHRSVTSEIERLFGSDALEPIPNDHELYSSFFVFDDGPPITGHELSGWGDGLIHRNLFQVEVDGRIGVLYSNKDYSSEWSYHAENKRFLALDNTRFGVNILVYALSR
jgi:hypothetical protein